MGIYNGEATIVECLESLIAQTFKDWEIVVCDDASTDNTFEILKKYSDLYPDKIVLLRNKNNIKLANTLNKCIGVSNGKYLARMDVDDIAYPTRLEKQVDFLDNNKQYDVVGSGASPFDSRGTRGVRLCPEKPSRKDLVKGAPHIHPTVMFRREALESLGGYATLKNTIRCEDLDLWYRFYASGFKGYNLQEPLLYYRESIIDYKRRTVKNSINMAKTMLKGYRLNKIPLGYYIITLKPIASSMLPRRLLLRYHHIKDSINQ